MVAEKVPVSEAIFVRLVNYRLEKEVICEGVLVDSWPPTGAPDFKLEHFRRPPDSRERSAIREKIADVGAILLGVFEIVRA